MKGSLIIVGFFVLGVLSGHFQWIPAEVTTHSRASFYALCLLMCCVGIGIGNNPKTLQNFRSLSPRMALLPVMTIAGTLTGCAVAGMCMPQRSVADCMAVGAGFGYYSPNTKEPNWAQLP